MQTNSTTRTVWGGPIRQMGLAVVVVQGKRCFQRTLNAVCEERKSGRRRRTGGGRHLHSDFELPVDETACGTLDDTV